MAEELAEEGLKRGRGVVLGRWPGRAGRHRGGRRRTLLGVLLLGLSEKVEEVLKRVAGLYPVPGRLLPPLLQGELLAVALPLGELPLVGGLALLANGVLLKSLRQYLLLLGLVPTLALGLLGGSGDDGGLAAKEGLADTFLLGSLKEGSLCLLPLELGEILLLLLLPVLLLQELLLVLLVRVLAVDRSRS